jgi:hypothetical protein
MTASLCRSLYLALIIQLVSIWPSTGNPLVQGLAAAGLSRRAALARWLRQTTQPNICKTLLLFWKKTRRHLARQIMQSSYSVLMHLILLRWLWLLVKPWTYAAPSMSLFAVAPMARPWC